MVLSSFHWIGWLIVLPTGIATQKYGSKIIVGYAACISSLMSSIIPFIADYGTKGIILVRMVQGLLIVSTYLIIYCPHDKLCNLAVLRAKIIQVHNNK